jgi:hypothetical protein
MKHISRKENSGANRLAQQASGYVVSQGDFWAAYVSLVAHRYALRSKGKSLLENSNRLQEEEKPIPDNTNQFSGKTGPDSGKTKPGSGKQSLNREKQNWDRVVKSGYGKKQSRLRLKGSRRSRLRKG